MSVPDSSRGGRRPARDADARAVAFALLERVESSGAYADLALRAALAHSALDARDRAFATELGYGTLRWRGHLDFLLGRVLDRPLERLEPRVRTLLRLGAYQLAFCDRVPDAAAVSESVRLAHAVGLGRAAGLVNAALRRLARERGAIEPPSLEADPLAHLVCARSIPRWIAERWIRDYGVAEAAALASASNAPPPRTVRANRTRTTRDDLLAELRARFPEAAPCRFAADGVTLGRRGDPAADPAFTEGRMTVQDEASQLVVELLDPQPGERVLDACAAPGAKATAIAERIGARGDVLALDRHARRLGLVARDAARLGLANVRTAVADASDVDAEALRGEPAFDRILVDAPCSGLGALRRNPDARWRVQPEAIGQLAELQRSILAASLPRLRRGGTLVYSTCTLSPEENEQVIDWLRTRAAETGIELRNPRELRELRADALAAPLRALVEPDGALRCWPQRHDADGFYAARLERAS
ncbi:MAG: 16S rRNA (cytosine(967)-C(5))-methyltransferase RsmB [Proteobacteria bacterium]|nr:MAG: 16S rRNA (cytosine(967)-C(5))-methyltransferase RsmB [Pseudomonadota bacterium]